MNELKAYCLFCGSSVGQISERTDEKVSTIYWCDKCEQNYCDQCSYNKNNIQYCLRCDTKLDKVEGK